jgi:hypothetical protein
LGDVQIPRSFTKAFLISYFNEVFQMMKIHN